MKAISHIFTSVYQKNKRLNLNEILLLLVLITLPIKGYAINSTAVILFLIFSLYSFLKKDKTFVINKISILFIGIYAVSFLSLIWSDNLKNTSQGLTRFLSYLIIPISFSLQPLLVNKKNKILDLFVKLLFFYSIYAVLMALNQAIKNQDISFLFYHKLSANFGNMNAIYLSVYTSFSVLFILIKKRKSNFDKFILLYLLLFLILLSSKTILIITFILLFHFILRKRFLLMNKQKKTYISLLFIVLLIAAFASTNIVNRVKVEIDKTKVVEVLNTKKFTHIYLWTGFGLRVFQVKMFYEISKEKGNILLGMGLNNAQATLNEKYMQYNLYPGFLGYNYHNQYIQIFAELGLFGLIVLLLIFFSIVRKAFISKDYLLLYFITLVLGVCLTETFLWRQRGMVFFLTITLLLYKTSRGETQKYFLVYKNPNNLNF